VTTREPGASEVLTWGGIVRPRSTAFRARRPAAIITDGFEVFVHEVMAAITTEPSRTLTSVSAEMRPLDKSGDYHIANRTDR